MGALGDLSQYEGSGGDPTAALSPFLRLPGIRVACFPPYSGAKDNPYLSLCYEHLAEVGFVVVPRASFTLRWLWRWRREVALLHFQWQPDFYYLAKRRRYADPQPRWPRLRSRLKLGGFAMRLRLARFFGYRIVWTIHEAYPPPSVLRPASLGHSFDRVGQGILARNCAGLMTHQRAVADVASGELGIDRDRIRVIPHGAYLDQYPPGRSRAEVRSELGIDPHAFVFLAFGSMRPDKSIGPLLEAFRAVGEPNVALIVAGRVDDFDSLRLLQAAAQQDPRIKALPGFVPDEDVRELFDAADASVLARGEEWTSGSVILSLTLGVPVVCARLAAHEQLVDERAGWLFDPESSDGLREALEGAAASSPSELNTRRLNAATAARALPPWEEIAEQMAFVMREAIGSEERFEQLAMRVWPLLEARSPAWKFFQTVPEAPPRPSSEWTEEAFAQQASLRAAASRGS
jgi:glycosyltransferase involved in cell wall biosynthesis